MVTLTHIPVAFMEIYNLDMIKKHATVLFVVSHDEKMHVWML